MKLDWISMVILFGFIQGTFVLYLFSIKNRPKQHRLFIGIMIILMITLVESFLLRSGLIIYTPQLINISAPLVFLLGPMLHEYILSLLAKKIEFKTRILHFLPFLFYFIYSFNFFLQPTSFKYNAVILEYHPDWVALPSTVPSFSMDPLLIQGWVVVEILTLHILLYCMISFLRVIKNKRQDSKIPKAQRNWMLYLIGILTLTGFILFFSQGGVVNGKVFLKSPFPYYSPDLFTTIGIYLIMLYLLLKPGFLNLKADKYKKSSLSEGYKKEKLKTLLAIIEKDALFLNSNFSLGKLSEVSGISAHHISQILNENLQCTFFQLTNRYRIDEAKKRLRIPGQYIKMEQLAYDLGYKSKSTFYAAFKKATKLTPSKYQSQFSSKAP